MYRRVWMCTFESEMANMVILIVMPYFSISVSHFNFKLESIGYAVNTKYLTWFYLCHWGLKSAYWYHLLCMINCRRFFLLPLTCSIGSCLFFNALRLYMFIYHESYPLQAQDSGNNLPKIHTQSVIWNESKWCFMPLVTSCLA
jgi:hypothetical protein